MTKKEKFDKEFLKSSPVSKMVIAVKLPSGATELIINTENIIDKFLYYKNSYNDDLSLINNPEVKIINYMFV
jgi:hypothetical protein